MTRVHVAVRLAAFLAVVIAIVVVAATVGLPSAAQLRGTLAPLGWWAGVGFAALYAALSLSPLPKTVFTLAAGATFGVAEGLASVLAGALLGAVSGFYLGRALGRDAVHQLIGMRLDRLDELLARRGFSAVLVARLVPVVPFTALNYAAGLTAVRFRDFLLATFFGILPATAAYVTIGAYGLRPGSWPLWAAIGALAALTAAGAVAGCRRRRHVLPAPGAAGTPPDGHVPDLATMTYNEKTRPVTAALSPDPLPPYLEIP